MKMHLFITAFLISTAAWAHDEGHGPKLTDAGKQGGIVSSVVSAKEAKLGAKASVVYKSEMVRSEDGAVRVYFYDKNMNPLDLSKFDKTAKGIVEIEKKKKVTKTPFSLKQDEGAFVGSAPKPSSRPFNIDITVKEGGNELLTAFDNLD